MSTHLPILSSSKRRRGVLERRKSPLSQQAGKLTMCSSKLTWSNLGSLTQISKRGSEITFRALARNPKSGKWTLSEPAKTALSAPEGRRFVHVQWNGLGIELAAFDDLGGVHVYSISSALSRLLTSQVVSSDRPPTEQDAVVTCFFLPLHPQEFRVRCSSEPPREPTDLPLGCLHQQGCESRRQVGLQHKRSRIQYQSLPSV